MSRGRGRLPLLLAIAGLLAAWGAAAAGCAAVESFRGQPEARPTASATYRGLLNRWTRQDLEYDELETKLLVWATYKSWPFRQAYVAEYARVYVLPEAEREALLEREIAALETYHDFVVAMYAPVRESAELIRERRVWRLYLEGPGGVRVSPSVVERIKEPLPVVSAFFPYVDRWSRVFLVRFPKQTADGRPVLPRPESDPFRLLLVSTEAHATLTWRP